MRFSYIIFSVLLVSYGLAAPVSQPAIPVDLDFPELSAPDVVPRAKLSSVVPGQVVKVAPKKVNGLPTGKGKAVRFSILPNKLPSSDYGI
jgi:hypothetical protein